MILCDFSSAFHKVVHRVASLNTSKNVEWIDMNQHFDELATAMLILLGDHFSLNEREFGTPVLCIDDKSGSKIWRKEYYPMYKRGRDKFRNSQTKFDYKDAYKFYHKMLDALYRYGNFPIVEVPTCEADDVIITLAEQCQSTGESCLILSPDKDFIQLQTTPNIKQYSWHTNKYIVPESKGGSLKEWMLEHVCLGDASDDVPRVVDFEEYNDGVKEYLLSKGIDVSPLEFSWKEYSLAEFEPFGGPFKRPRFGLSTLKKKIEEYGTLKDFINSNPLYRENFERNMKLVLGSGIPENLKENIKAKYREEYAERSRRSFDIAGLCEHMGVDPGNLPPYFANKYIVSINNFAW